MRMTSQTIPVEPFDFVVFGGTGDLAERKLLPALYQRQKAGQLSEPTRIIGASRSELSNDEFREFARKAMAEQCRRRTSTTVRSSGSSAPLLCPGRCQIGRGFDR